MLKPGWFLEYTPEEQLIYKELVDNIEYIFSKSSYINIQTPAVESNNVLLAKWWEEASKQIFWLYWLAQWIEDPKSYSLHFDHTIPFARYVIDYYNELSFPFKKYQIWKVRRWERQQKWRFKEFTQADIDVIWNQEKFDNIFHYDSEIVVVLYTALLKIKKKLWLNVDFIININNKKIISSFLDAISKDDNQKNNLAILIDKYEKITKDEFYKESNALWLSYDDIEKLLSLISSDFDISELDSISDIVSSDEYTAWINELKITISQILAISESIWIDMNYKINLWIIRGLDYYTWMVFETFVSWYEGFWSVCSWGRYDWLTKFLDPKKDCSWVGWSIWVDRLLSLILDKWLVNKEFSLWPDYFFINFDDTYTDILSILSVFYKKWYKIEIYPFEDKFKKQLQLANKKWAKNVVIFWEKEKQDWVIIIKNMETWEEEKLSINKFI